MVSRSAPLDRLRRSCLTAQPVQGRNAPPWGGLRQVTGKDTGHLAQPCAGASLKKPAQGTPPQDGATGSPNPPP